MMPGFSDDDGKVLISDTLRLFVGQGRRFSWADLAVATGDDERKLRSYVEQPHPAMPFPVFMRVFTVLPPEAFGRVARFMGFNSAPGLADEQATMRRAMAQASRFVADGNEALEDGELTPKEQADMRDRAMAMLPMIAAIAGVGATQQ